MANIVAILLVGGLFFMLSILFLVVSAASGDRRPNVKANSILTIDSKTVILDSPTEDQDGIFSFGSKEKKVLIYDLIEAIKNAKTDSKIKGISIESDMLRGGISQISDLRNAGEDFKKTGKFVYAYGNNVSQPSYYLGSVADRYYLHPAGGIDLRGMSTEVVYLKSFTEKYGIGTEVIRHGKFKAAVEPFMRDDMSEENREQLSTMLNDFWSDFSGKISTSRKMDTASLNVVADSLYAVIADSGLKYKLVDKLVQKSEYDSELKSKLKVEQDKDLNKISVSKYIRSFKDVKKDKENQVAVLYASGQIFNGEGYSDIYSENFVKQIQDVAKNKKVKAVVLRVNSPGGSANASDEILFELQQLKKKKPLIVSFGDYAASGGYYIGMAADKIYSSPNTITGSIGVFGLITYFKDLAERNGVSAHAVETNDNSVFYSPVNGLSDGARNIMSRSVEATYKRFVDFVTKNRKKSFAEIDEVGGGRVWSGKKAKDLGLVDELGGLHDAVAFAAQKANLKDYNVSAYPKKKSKFEQFFEDMDQDNLSAKMIESKIGKEKFKIFQQITDPKLQGGVMMQLPYSIEIR